MSDQTQLSSHSRPVESQRLDAFVDAAFAFAVSLLIIAGASPCDRSTTCWPRWPASRPSPAAAP